MTESGNGSEEPYRPYRPVYSERVRDELKNLARRARAAGRGAEFLAALKALDRRLRIYPQFGQPLRNLTLEQAQEWIGVVPPLVVQYVLDEERRVVMVVVPIRPLPNAGF